MLSEAAITDNGNSSTRTDKEHSRISININSNRTSTITTCNWKSGTNSNNIYTYTIRDLRFICSELYDVLRVKNKRFEILILLDVITILTSTVPANYTGYMALKGAIFENGPFQLYLTGVTNHLELTGYLLTYGYQCADKKY
jgi:hypothetical protein